MELKNCASKLGNNKKLFELFFFYYCGVLKTHTFFLFKYYFSSLKHLGFSKKNFVFQKKHAARKIEERERELVQFLNK